MMIKTLVWDFDGTLFDTYPAIGRAFVTTLDELGHSASLEWVLGLVKESMDVCINALAETYTIDHDILIDRFMEHYERVTDDDQPPFPGVQELCQYIKDKGGQNLLVTHRGSKSTPRFLTKFGLTPLFQDIITSDDNFPRKPDPTAFNAILARNQVDRATALGIGDRELDVLAAKGAGIRACLFADPETQTAADFTFSDFAELHQRILDENKTAPVA
jgi:HAD superfamily hydrolase (TIGR01549 family)